MKKFIALLMVALLAFSMFAACGKADNNDNNKTDETTGKEETKFDPAKKDEGTMTYAQYAEAALNSKVTIEAFVQANQSWWEKEGKGVITVYAQDPDGAYFLYEMACATKADADKLTKGAKIKVTGYKSEWEGEVEITDATYELMEGTWVAEATDVTALLGTDDLIKKQNQFVAIKGATVAASKDKDGKDVAFLYNWDGSGKDGSDLYFNITVGDKTYNLCVESYLCDNTTAVYTAVKNLKIGDKIDLEGFLYWYKGVNPHITAVAAAK